MTEAEAKTKWCPLGLIRSASVNVDAAMGAAGINRDMQGQPIKKISCIGSDCMAWRELGRSVDGINNGYCGAFGKP